MVNSNRAHGFAIALACAAMAAVAPPAAASGGGGDPADVQVIQGVIGPGASYEIRVPSSWNGDLVLYARGWSEVPWLPDMGPLREDLLALGYAVAYSSYSEGGLAIKDGALRTQQLEGIFAARFGQPARTYLTSWSMGGAIVLRLAETYPRRYAGVLPMCGIVAGSQAAFDYYFHVRALFEYFYPAVLPAGLVSFDSFWAEVAPAVMQAISLNPSAAMELAGVHQVDIRYQDEAELVQSILLPIFFSSWDSYVGDLQQRAHGPAIIDNTQAHYTGSANDAALNAGIARYASTPAAKAYFKQWYETTGQLTTPVLTLHGSRDPVVPHLHEDVYGARVAAAGRSDLLVQRVTPEFGHCAFDPSQQLAAFTDLVTWVRTGVKPAP
jgi:pimeloyl-ACP methyl ester carboxylesterase